MNIRCETVAKPSRRGGTGRRAGLKIRYSQECVGSNPSAGRAFARSAKEISNVEARNLETKFELPRVVENVTRDGGGSFSNFCFLSFWCLFVVPSNLRTEGGGTQRPQSCHFFLHREAIRVHWRSFAVLIQSSVTDPTKVAGGILAVKPLQFSIQLRMPGSELAGTLEECLGRHGEEFRGIRGAVGVSTVGVPASSAARNASNSLLMTRDQVS